MQSVPTPCSESALVASRDRRRPSPVARRPSPVARRPSPVARRPSPVSQVLGGAWTPNVVCYLKEQPRRFTELKADLAGVSAKTVTAKLRKLERDGVVNRKGEVEGSLFRDAEDSSPSSG